MQHDICISASTVHEPARAGRFSNAALSSYENPLVAHYTLQRWLRRAVCMGHHLVAANTSTLRVGFRIGRASPFLDAQQPWSFVINLQPKLVCCCNCLTTVDWMNE